MNHFVPGTNPFPFSKYKLNIPWDYVSKRIDRQVLNEILLAKKLINQEVPRIESEAWRIT